MEKILDIENNVDIKDDEEIPLIESKVIPIQTTCGIDASTFLIRLGVLFRKDNDGINVMAFIENESEEKLVLKRGKVYHIGQQNTKNRYDTWKFEKLDILPGTKSLSPHFAPGSVNDGIKVYFSFTARWPKKYMDQNQMIDYSLKNKSALDL